MYIISCANEDAWHAERVNGIGASEAAAVIGASPWASALTVWARKLGLDDDSPDGEAIEWGKELESLIASKYARVTGRPLNDLGPYTVLVDADRPWMRCTLDRVIAEASDHAGEGPGVLEIKTAGAQFARQWESDGIPRHYWLQVQHQLSVTGYQWGAVAVLLGGQKFRHADVERDDATIEELRAAEEHFWHAHVLAQLPPAPDGTEATRALLARLYPAEAPAAALCVLPPEAADWDAARVEAAAQLKYWEGQKTQAENLLKAAIANAPGGRIPGGVTYLWKSQTRKAYSVAESTARVLRRKGGEDE